MKRRKPLRRALAFVSSSRWRMRTVFGVRMARVFGLTSAIVQVLLLVLVWQIEKVSFYAFALMTGAALVTSLGCALIGWLSGNWLALRMRRMIDGLERAHEGDYSMHLRDSGRDELGLLTRRINKLLDSASRREHRIRQSALTDPLTGVANRTLLSDRIEQAITHARRARSAFAVAVIDIDRFKLVNDTLGHGTGDRLLKEVARRLKATVRDADTVARLGGDEFVLLLEGDQDAACEVVGRVLAATREPLRLKEQLIDITLSIGIAMFPDHGETDVSLLRAADSAMYRAKRQQAGFLVSDGKSSELRRSYLSMLGELRAALDGGQFVLDYQPKLDLQTGLIVGLEGLVRWNHPTQGRVPPGEFIPFSEQTGFMREITRWVIGEGARFSALVQRANLDICVSVNITAQDLQDAGFAPLVRDTITSAGLASRHLCLEITESGVVSESPMSMNNLRTIAELGVKLSVDDFGTGYSTLKQLQQLPVQELKIDRSFVNGMHQNQSNHTIVRSTIDLARQLGLSVVAEGVETVKELRALAVLGCHEVQGYYVAKPMLAGEVVAWIEMRHALHASSREKYFEMLIRN